MEMELYALNGYLDPLAIWDKPVIFSDQIAAMNLLRMELMDSDETMTLDQSFLALHKIPMQELIKLAQEREAWLLGTWDHHEIADMYEKKGLHSWVGQKMIPVMDAYKDIYEDETENLTDEQVEANLLERLEYDLRLYLEENLPYESPYV